jgi:hypothetical protein
MVLNGVKAVPNGVKVTPKTATAPPSAKKQKKLYHTDSEGESLGRGQLREKKLDRTGDARRPGLAKLKALKEARKSGVVVSSMGLAEESQSGSGSDDDAISVDSSDLDKDEEGFIAPDDSDGEAAELPAQFSSKRHYSIEESVTKAIEFYLMTNFHVEDFPSQVREAKDSSLLEILEPIEDLLRKIDARKKQIPEAQWPRDFVHALDMNRGEVSEQCQGEMRGMPENANNRLPADLKRRALRSLLGYVSQRAEGQRTRALGAVLQEGSGARPLPTRSNLHGKGGKVRQFGARTAQCASGCWFYCQGLVAEVCRKPHAGRRQEEVGEKGKGGLLERSLVCVSAGCL